MAAMSELLITTADALQLDPNAPVVAVIATHQIDPARRPLSLLSEIVDYEDGDLSPLATMLLFGRLIATGYAWTLQGGYGRAATGWLESGALDETGRLVLDSPAVLEAAHVEADADAELLEDPDVAAALGEDDSPHCDLT